MNRPAATPTAALIDRVSALRFEQLPPDVVMVARHCIRDWTAVGLAGSTEPISRYLRDEVLERDSAEEATSFGASRKVTAHDAALCNGAAAHALDFDDVLETMLGHPTAPVLSAAMAVGEKIGASGAHVLTAFVAGVETESIMGRMMEPGHHEAGWHTTGTLGTFGATAAVAHLLQLQPGQWSHALGLAAAQAAGVKAGFGTMAKPFHAGRAAANGVLAASLARRGVTAAHDVIEAPRGYADLTTTTFDPTVLDSRSEHRFDIREVLFKRHASCYLTHSLIEGLLHIRPSLDTGTADITEIRMNVLPVHLTTCGVDDPATPLEGKFSLRFVAGLALVAGQAGEQQFTDEWLAHPEVRRLSALVHITPDHDGSQMATPVHVHTHTGRTLRSCVDVGIPASGEDLFEQQDRLVEKFRSLAYPVLGDAAEPLSALIETFDSLDDVRSFMAHTRAHLGVTV
ncbi:MmgE/PrpD family protein [Rhodococcus aetherivorans]|uniref:MmgE/PrpD family protein n=1 Tax=Rhodococcus aetherivorans TaxID=191292 RepID=UPI00163AE0BD|nr:MmgE/PrpD family protein [Rhodococcus aetherivorans]MBC2586895.1 MmgE/PrpD family protein [Rhodococcus aetherivorans]